MSEALSAFIGKLSNEVNRGEIVVNVFFQEVLVDTGNTDSADRNNEKEKDHDVNHHQRVFESVI